MTLPPFLYVFPVWGAAYVERLLTGALPSLLSPGNLPAMANAKQSTVLIVTDPEGQAVIQASPIFEALRGVTQVQIAAFSRTPPMPTPYSKYSHQAAAYEVGRRKALGRAALMCITADAVFSDGFLPALGRRLSRGAWVVAGVGPRVSEAGFIDRVGRPAPGESLFLSPETATRLVAKAPHPDFTSVLENAKGAPGYFGAWKAADGSGFALRATVLHPYLIDCRRPEARSIEISTGSPLDVAYLARLSPPDSGLACLTDSAEAIVLSVTPDDDVEPLSAKGASTVEERLRRGLTPAKEMRPQLGDGLCAAIEAIRRRSLRHSFVYRWGPRTEALSRAERDAERAVAHVLEEARGPGVLGRVASKIWRSQSPYEGAPLN